jgi:hypothetical protein
MSTAIKARKPRQAKPVVRTVRLALTPFEGNPGIVTIRASKVVHEYFILPLDSDFGRAFRLEMFTGELA